MNSFQFMSCICPFSLLLLIFFSPFCFLYIFSFLVLLELEQVTNELFSLIIEKDNINNYFLLNFFQKIDGGFVLTHPICSL